MNDSAFMKTWSYVCFGETATNSNFEKEKTKKSTLSLIHLNTKQWLSIQVNRLYERIHVETTHGYFYHLVFGMKLPHHPNGQVMDHHLYRVALCGTKYLSPVHTTLAVSASSRRYITIAAYMFTLLIRFKQEFSMFHSYFHFWQNTGAILTGMSQNV